MIPCDERYRLKKMASLVKGQNVLDIGCTELPNNFLKANYLVGFDLNLGRLPENYTKLVVEDVYNLPYPFRNEKFDTIVIGEVLEHVENPVLFLKKCITVLRPTGRVVLSTPNPLTFYEIIFNIVLSRKYMYSKEHITLYPQRYLIRLLEIAGLKDVKLYSGGLNLPFVSGKKFPWFGLVPFPRPFCYQTIAVAHLD